MANIEAIIGKEEGLHRLLIKIGQKAFVVGNPQSVPNSVSRTHCSLSVDYSDDTARQVKKNKNSKYEIREYYICGRTGNRK